MPVLARAMLILAFSARLRPATGDGRPERHRARAYRYVTLGLDSMARITRIARDARTC